MTKIKSGAICLFFYAWVLLCFFNLPVIWLSVLKSFILPLQHFLLVIYFTYLSCIVYGSGTGAGDLVRFGYL